MATFNKILVPFDNNLRSIGALEYAAMFASGIGAKITALHLADPNDFHSKAEFQKDLMELVDEQLRPKMRTIQKSYPDIQKIDLQVRGLQKSIAGHIIDFAKENDIDFINMRSHGLPETGDWELHFKSTIAYNVVLEAPCPVFTFTQIPTNPKMKNILVPLDLSEGSLYKIPLAVTIARQFNARLHLLSSSENKEDHQELLQQIEEVGKEVEGMGVEIFKNSIYSGNLPDAITWYTSKSDIDLVMIMNRPGFRWSDLWVSPKAKRIISHSKVPVISIRSNKPLEVDL